MFTITNFDANTIITLENVREILADMGVTYHVRTYQNVTPETVQPKLYSDGNAYETPSLAKRLRSGVRKRTEGPKRSRKFYLVGKTVEQALFFLNTYGLKEDEKTTEESADNYIQRPNLKAAANITIDNDNKPIIEMTGIRATSMETMRSLNPKRAELIDRIFCGPKKRGFERRPSKNRVSDHCKPVYNVTTGELSYKATFSTPANHLKYGTAAYNAELLAITKSCEYNKPTPEGDKPYSGQQFQWAAEMPMEKLEEILTSMKEAKCRTYADYKRKKAKAESKALAASFTQAVNSVNGNLSDSVAMEILAQLKKLNAGMEKLAAMWE